MSIKTAYDLETSQILLIKSLLAQPSVIPSVAEIIQSDDFDNEKYREIFLGVVDLYINKKEITPSEVFSYLQTKNISFLTEDLLLFEEPPIDSPITLAKILKENSIKKTASELLQESNQNILSNSNILETLGDLIVKSEQLSFRLTNDNKKKFKDAVDKSREEALSEKSEDNYCIPTPYESLNKYLSGGLRPSKMFTIGARPAVGKTVVATGLAMGACVAGKSALYFSLEMGAEELIKRIAAAYGNILLSDLKPGPNKSEELKQKIRDTYKEIRKWKLDIVDDDDVSIEKVRAIAQKKAQSSDGLDLVIIDYLQLMAVRPGRSRQEEVAEISRSCKVLSRQLGIPVVILVQLNRENKNDDPDRIPGKEDIKESGAIAADSDQVLILHRKMRDDSTDPKALFILDKNRDGPSNKMLQMRCVLEKNIFQDLRTEFKNSEENSETTENTQEGFGQEKDIIKIEEKEQYKVPDIDDEELFNDLFDEEDLFRDDE